MAREPHFVVKYSSYLGTAIKLVLYIVKQLLLAIIECGLQLSDGSLRYCNDAADQLD